MNLSLHIIKNDLRRCRWPLIFWSLALGYLFLTADRPKTANDLLDYLQLTTMFVVLIMSIALIADIVQADHPTRADAHWRTMPISPLRLAVGKILLTGALFVALPMTAIWLKNLTASLKFFAFPKEYGLFILVLSSLTLSLVAVAACTKNVVQCLLLWLGLYFGALALADFLTRFAPVLSRRALAEIGLEKALLCLVLSVVFALAVIFNQYLRRRQVVSIVLMLICAVGTATIGAFYGYFYQY
jgi:hypothetical protein